MESPIYDHELIYEEGPSDKALQSVQRIYQLARVGLASTGTELSLDLGKSGFDGLFEAIIELADSAGDNIENVQLTHKLGIYGEAKKATKNKGPRLGDLDNST